MREKEKYLKSFLLKLENSSKNIANNIDCVEDSA